ncbi:hypothetical protein [Vallitalea guaymasensis]|uniref:Uncharacterized protein n=1 Tax=Vallitalea guaymasensis TaxID=1185412 RepID=A0A8J8MDY2_9FIRM|nr:hypothetical protein [Vallitalea guaymasensis]QUH31137.1 hypothetical protein HYG85_20315 [Vallitalea guaymasensis]
MNLDKMIITYKKNKYIFTTNIDSMFVIEDTNSFIDNLKKSFSKKLVCKNILYEDINRRLVHLLKDEDIRKLGLEKNSVRLEIQSIAITDYETGQQKIIQLNSSAKEAIKSRYDSLSQTGIEKSIRKSNIEGLHFSKEFFYTTKRIQNCRFWYDN